VTEPIVRRPFRLFGQRRGNMPMVCRSYFGDPTIGREEPFVGEPVPRWQEQCLYVALNSGCEKWWLVRCDNVDAGREAIACFEHGGCGRTPCPAGVVMGSGEA
jgi:hypothetical protein